MPATKFTPEAAKALYRTADLNGKTYSYILSEPKGEPIDTVFLVHGWPDLSFGWRNQIPFLTELGLRVVAMDMMGYGQTDAPEELEFYTYKRAAEDIATLAKILNAPRIILGGHDWGGAIVFRVAMYYPALISAVFSVCTPFFPPEPEYISLGLVLPNFKYQLQLAGPDVEKAIVSEEMIGGFLRGAFGAKTKEGEGVFGVEHGVYLDRVNKMGKCPLLSEKEVIFYVERYRRTGMRGPLNWYRTGELNWANDQKLDFDLDTYKFKMPALFVAGSRDAAIPPELSTGMEQFFRSLTRGEVDSGHWALYEQPEEINLYLKEFILGRKRVCRK